MVTQKLQIFSKNKTVEYHGKFHTVEHVVLKDYDLYVKLSDIIAPVISTDIQCEYTDFELSRKY